MGVRLPSESLPAVNGIAVSSLRDAQEKPRRSLLLLSLMV